MDGPSHYAEAERLLAWKPTYPMTAPDVRRRVAENVAEAQVHATLALTAAQYARAGGISDAADWQQALGHR